MRSSENHLIVQQYSETLPPDIFFFTGEKYLPFSALGESKIKTHNNQCYKILMLLILHLDFFFCPFKLHKFSSFSLLLTEIISEVFSKQPIFRKNFAALMSWFLVLFFLLLLDFVFRISGCWTPPDRGFSLEMVDHCTFEWLRTDVFSPQWSVPGRRSGSFYLDSPANIKLLQTECFKPGEEKTKGKDPLCSLF